MKRAKIYLAGPEVFLDDCEAIFRSRQAVCRRLGLEPLVPVDGMLTTAAEIFAANCRLLSAADAVIANISPFRGPHCDVGTAWEIGYAIALALPVFGFSSDQRRLIERIAVDEGTGRDRAGAAVENFGLTENLMIAESIAGEGPYGSFEEAAKAAAKRLSRQRLAV